MTAPAQIHDLVNKFERGRGSYTQPAYNEAQLRQEFVNPFFAALGWDVGDSAQVLHEAALKSGRTTKHPDYSFLAGKRRAFYVETKKPAIGINTAIEPAGQLRSYGWSGNTAVGILTNFAEFAVYDCRIQPQQGDDPSAARIDYLTSAQYVDRWQQLYDTLSREAVQAGKHRSILDAAAKGVLPVDAAFLRDMENWRSVLAEHLHKQAYFVVDQELSQRELNLLVQRTIDRIVFLRIAEDRNLEEYGTLEKAAQAHNVYERLKHLYRAADAKYNSGLFHFDPADKTRPDADTLSMAIYIPDNVLRNIINALYPPQSRYQFSVISADILGQVYERFLGKVIEVRSVDHETRVSVVEKPEVRKAGGVYYTPEYIVDYIVENTVGKLLEGKTTEDAAMLRVLDPACGSGSFLAGAYQHLLDWHLAYYSQYPRKHKNVLRSVGNEYVLKIPEKRRILLNSIYGVDLDQNAVEVSKLSLLLKMLENEDGTDAGGLHSAGERILPDLRGNIKWGNSLVGSDFYDGADVGGLTDDELQRVMAFDWDGAQGFADIVAAGGFDAVIGNPPWLMAGYYTKQTLKHLKEVWETAKGKFDLYYLFIELATKLCSAQGRIGMIVPNKYFHTSSARRLRTLLAESVGVERIVDFGHEQIFTGATNYSSIAILQPSLLERTIYTRAHRDMTISQEFTVSREFLHSKIWSFVPPKTRSLFRKMESASSPLSSLVQRFGTGMQTGADRILTYTEHETISKGFELDLMKPMLRGRDVRRYGGAVASKLTIFPYSETGDEFRILSEGELMSRKNVYTVLTTHKEKLSKRVWFGKSAEELSGHWFGVMYLDSRASFCKPHLLVPSLSNRSNFTLGTGDLFATGTAGVTSVILADDVMENIRYLLGVLNSQLLNMYATMNSPVFSGGYHKFSAPYLKELPVRVIDFDNADDVSMHDEMVGLVERMLALHKGYADYTDAQRAVADAQIERVDRQIDALVYRLYGLSDEEVGVVEGAIATARP